MLTAMLPGTDVQLRLGSHQIQHYRENARFPAIWHNINFFLCLCFSFEKKNKNTGHSVFKKKSAKNLSMVASLISTVIEEIGLKEEELE